MHVVATGRRQGEAFDPDARHAVAIGVFDGVHRGHQLLLRHTVAVAEKDQCGSLVYTFDPHPARVLGKNPGMRLLEPLTIRLERFAACGIASTQIERFDERFAAMEPDEFIRGVLVNHLSAKHIVVGSAFRFGRGQRGTLDMLRAAGETYDFEVHEVPALKLEGHIVSSTRIRDLVMAGDIRHARELLGHPLSLQGPVSRGAGRGVKLGFGTANISPVNEIMPATGVYAAMVRGVAPRPHQQQAVVNIGHTPTFGNHPEIKVEAHIFDHDGSALYGQILTVDLIERLRAEQRFASVDQLKSQIQMDCDSAKEILRKYVAMPALHQTPEQGAQ